MTISTKTKNGLIIAIFSLGFYSPFAGYLTSYSAIAENLSTALNINNIYTSGLNSFAFALAVGSGPITTQFLTNKKFGFKWTTFAGFIIASLGLLAASFATKLWQIFLKSCSMVKSVDSVIIPILEKFVSCKLALKLF